MRTLADRLGHTAALLSIDAAVSEDSYLVKVAGELDASNVELLQTCLRQAEASEERRIVVDLSALGFMDSSGLRALLEAAARTGDEPDRLCVVAGSRAVRRVIELTAAESRLPLVD